MPLSVTSRIFAIRIGAFLQSYWPSGHTAKIADAMATDIMTAYTAPHENSVALCIFILLFLRSGIALALIKPGVLFAGAAVVLVFLRRFLLGLLFLLVDLLVLQ